LGLVDNQGHYILRNASGVGSFYFIANNQKDLSENQHMIVEKISLESNATWEIVKNTGRDLKGRVEDVDSLVVENSDSLCSVVGGAGIVVLLVWVFVLKPYLRGGGLEGFKPELRNPLKPNNSPPSCYKDGVTFNPLVEPACNTCNYSRACEKTKIEHEAMLEMPDTKQRITLPDSGVDLGSVDPVQSNIDISTW
jgi:hypothetical protein